MPELRQDPTTKDWVIIAPERAKRPDEFRSAEIRSREPDFDPACPFCPGSEASTPRAVRVQPDSLSAVKAEWQVRVVPNKFPALSPHDAPERTTQYGFFQSMRGFGYHEVIIETPVHNRYIPAMQRPEVEAILRAYRDRFLAIREDRGIEFILIFKNHGEGAGTSLSHPHSQLIATPVLPVNLRRKYDEAIRHYGATGRCLYCDVVEAERAAGERVIRETLNFFIFHPFASYVPFEIWILPKIFRPTFGQISPEELTELSGILIEVIGGLGRVLNDPDYNLVVHSASVRNEQDAYFLWHVRIVPRVTKFAGFEIGSGMPINIERPEVTARILRNALKSE